MLYIQQNVSRLEEGSQIEKYVAVRKVGLDKKNESKLEKWVTVSKMCHG